MTALKGAAVAAFVERRDPAKAGVLVYGPDGGLVRERAVAIAKQVVSDFKDPFNYIELSEADLKAQPARITDEAAALSFAGGERLIRIRINGETAPPAVTNFLTELDAGHLKPNALVIIEAGALTPRSSLRKGFEKSKSAIALPCYADAPRDIKEIAAAAARSARLRFEPEALEHLAAVLGEDRALSNSEIEKVLLYMGPGEDRIGSDTITADDVRLCLADALGDVSNAVTATCLDGSSSGLADALAKADQAGASPIALLRALQRQFSRLNAAQLSVEAGDTAAEAMRKLRPPVFFAERRAFEARMSRWRGPKLNRARRILFDAEISAKNTGAPQQEIVERAALSIAVLAQR